MLTLGFGEVAFGPPGELSRADLMGARWAINLAVAAWVIRGRSAPAAAREWKRPIERRASYSIGNAAMTCLAPSRSVLGPLLVE